EWLPLGDDHFEHPFELPARLVEDVGHAIAVFGHAQRAVALTTRGGHQLSDGDAAIDDVFSVVAGIVPAAADIERVVAGPGFPIDGLADRRRLAADGCVAPVGRDADVARRTA